MRKFILAITGASGSIYARQCLDALLEDKTIDEVAIIVTPSALDVMKYEGESILSQDKRVVFYENDNYFSPPASGSARYEAMIIVPSSTGTMGRIASGVCTDLISRSADVMLKERRKLILAVRESPLSLIHLNNMTLLTQSGAIIMPLSPEFYTKAESIEQLTANFSRRIARSAGAQIESYEWGK